MNKQILLSVGLILSTFLIKAGGAQDLNSAIKKSIITLPNNYKNPAIRSHFVQYLGTGKSSDNTGHQRSVPFHMDMASCDVDTDTPRVFISQTLKDPRSSANPDHPRVGSIYEAILNSQSGKLELTGNQRIVEMCNETHDIVVTSDCSRLAVLCATEIEAPVSATFKETFRDLVAEAGSSHDDYYYFNQVNNENIIDSNFPGLAPPQRQAKYKYNGEIWLLEWVNPSNLQSEPQKFVIHKGYGGGDPYGVGSLSHNEADNSYAAAFVTNLFDSKSGDRHHSAALLVIERDGWKLNPNERGWAWACGNGHVFTIRSFWNDHYTSIERPNGMYGAMCNTDGNRFSARFSGSVGIKHEDISSTSFHEGGIQYLFPSFNGGVSNGGAHQFLPLHPDKSIGVLTAPEIHPWHDQRFLDYIEFIENLLVGSGGDGLTGLNACNYESFNTFYMPCLMAFTSDYFPHNHPGNGNYPLFDFNFHGVPHQDIGDRDISKVGIFHTETYDTAGPIPQSDGDLVKWLAVDEDCMMGAPQLVDLKDGTLLLGYGKFQCISDGFPINRYATTAINTRSVATRIPSEYYIQVLNSNGDPITEPTLLSNTGWGEQNTFINLGEGRAAWAYIPNPTLSADGTFAQPEQFDWELMVFESPEWIDLIFTDGFE